MDWNKVINEILWMKEIGEKELSIYLETPITQSGLNRIKRGVTQTPNYILGAELIKLHKKLLKLHRSVLPC